MRLQAKILTAMMPLVVVPLLALGWAAYVQLRDSNTHEALALMEARVHEVAEHIQLSIRTATANVGLFADSRLLEQYLGTTDINERYGLMQSPLLQLFSSYQKAYPNYYEIHVLLPDGSEELRAALNDDGSRPEDPAELEVLRRMQDLPQATASRFFIDPETREVALYVSKRVAPLDKTQDPAALKHTLLGHLALTVSLSDIESEIAVHSIGKTGALFLTDEQGTVLLHKQKDHKNTKLPAPLFQQLHDLALRGGYRTAIFNDTETVFQGARIHKDLLLFAMLPQSELSAASRKLGLLMAGITFATILLTVSLLMGFLKRTLIKPIQALGAAAIEIGRGNLGCSLDVHSRNELGELATAFKDMSRSLETSNERISYLAYHDHLTGLPNRLMFNEYLTHALAHAQRTGGMLALLFLDVDNFKRINDTLGHQAGDALLKEFSTRLTQCLRDQDYLARSGIEDGSDTVARLGGDEFTFILPSIKDPLMAGSIAQRILDVMAQSFTIEQQEMFITTSIGITTFPYDAADAETLVKFADIAMYHAKERGKNNYQYYSAEMNQAAGEKLTMENQLRKALERDELLLHYQPLIEAHSGRVVGAEALMRWQHPEFGMVPPGQFIPIAEECGLIVAMGEWALRTACAQARAWQRQGLPELIMSVNISSHQFRRQRLDILIGEILHDTELAPALLEVELTESALMQVEAEAVEIMDAIKALGVHIALDDFGTCYSSLTYLRRFPFDRLKIDRSFVNDITTDPSDAAIIKSVIALAHGLNLSVTAEGVETEEQSEFLCQHGCDTLQGYLFARPLAPQQFAALLRDSNVLRARA